MDDHFLSPGLLYATLWPVVSTHVRRGVVQLLELHQRAEDRVRCHDDEGDGPGGGDHLVGVRARLPRPRLERVADGTIALYRYGDQAECGDADRDSC